MATVFWDLKGILLTEFMAPGTTVMSEVYCETTKLQKLVSRYDKCLNVDGNYVEK